MQGVWFRQSTLEEAQKICVKGFVRNEPDGTVYTEAEGSEEQLQQFIEWCKHGPKFARVDKLETTESPVENFTDFKIR